MSFSDKSKNVVSDKKVNHAKKENNKAHKIKNDVLVKQNNSIFVWQLIKIITSLILLSIVVRMVYYSVSGIKCGIAYEPNVCYGINAIIWFLFVNSIFEEGILWLISIILFIVSSCKCYKIPSSKKIDWVKIKFISIFPFLLVIACMIFFSIVGLEPELFGHIYYGVDAIKFILNKFVFNFWIVWLILVIILGISIYMCHKKKNKK